MKFNIRMIEQALDDFILGADLSFSLAQAVDAVCETLCAEDSDRSEISNEVDSLLEEYDLLEDEENQTFWTQSEFFRGVKFCVTPSAYEIQHNMLIPGHRFSCFICDSVFPSEIDITAVGSEKRMSTLDIEMPLYDASGYHALLGSEDMFNYFIADNRGNQASIQTGNPDTPVTLTVIDMNKFYKAHSFKEGDQLIFTCTDFDNGVFTFEYRRKNDVDSEERSTWIDAFEKALYKVFDSKGYYLSIPEQLSIAYFLAGDAVCKNPAMSIDEFQEESDNVQLIMIGNHTVLWKDGDPFGTGETEESDLPEEMVISQGNTDSLEELLKDVGCPIRPIEIESLVYDELYMGGETPEPIIDRCLYYKTGTFADDVQEAVFLNYVEERWEVIMEDYRREADSQKGQLRSRVMRLLEERLMFYREVGERFAGLPQEQIDALDELVDTMCNLLRHLNSDDYFADDEEFEKAVEGIENLGDIQEQIIHQMELTLSPEE